MSARTLDETAWPVVWVAFGAGVVAAMHIGKLPPALGMIREELGAGLVTAGWIASMISAIGVMTGLVAGAVADRIGPRRIMVFGLLMLVAGGVAGSLAHTPAAMLGARFVEGIGFTATTVTGGILIARATTQSDRRWALAVWAAFMPLGFSSMLLVSAALLDSLGWRAIWLVCAAISLVWALAVLIVMAGFAPANGRAAQDSLVRGIGANLTRIGGLLAALCYAVYAAQHIGMMNWLPTYMVETRGAGVLLGAAVAASVLLCNAGGNFVAAWGLSRGIPIWALLAIGALGMATAVLAIFGAPLHDTVPILCLLGFGVAGGLIPAAALAAAPVYAPSPALVGVMSGLMVMATNTGQLMGAPMLAAARALAGSWDGTVSVLLSLSAVGLVAALASRRYERAARG